MYKIRAMARDSATRRYLTLLIPQTLKGDKYIGTERGLFRYKCMLSPKFLFLNVLRPNGMWGACHNVLMPMLEGIILYAAVLGAIQDGRIDCLTKEEKGRLYQHLSHIDKFNLILCYRGFFKTTLFSELMNICMMLVNPDIRILVMSGSLGNAETIVGAIKGHFVTNEIFRWAFPEYCPVAGSTGKIDFGTLEKFSLPNRSTTIQFREPTIQASSPTTKLAGYHFDYHNLDDLIDQKNVTTEEQLKKVKQGYQLSLSLFDNPSKPFATMIGTRYHSLDLYADIIKLYADGLNNVEYITYDPRVERLIKAKRKAI